MPKFLKAANVDLMHFPHFNVPLFSSLPYIVTIHDLILLSFPTVRGSTLPPFMYWFKYAVWRTMMKIVLRRAKRIIVPSYAVASDLERHFHVSQGKMAMIYEGSPKINSQLSTPNSQPSIRHPYLLYVGSAYPHKNLEALIQAFRILRDREHLDVRLTLVGKSDYFYERLRKEFMGKLQDVTFTGQVTDAELGELYCNASLYVFPAFIEGFGLPALEAASHGLPVVVSSTPALKEIMGDAAIYFDPRNVEEMASAIKQTLQDEALRKKMVAAGYERIKKFSWEKMARETLEVYQK
jgi:glycosyltransferase involved in cell wall biosynthesis